MNASRATAKASPERELYREFLRLGGAHRRRVAVRILRNQKMLSDLYDHFLIQRSLHEPGQNLAWESYAKEPC